LKILLNQHWKIAPKLQEVHEGYENMISGRTAGLVIGDRALSQRTHSKYIYDLALEWKAMTGLPFVFAAWVSNKKITDVFLLEFNESLQKSLLSIDEIVSSMNYSDYDLSVYYKHNINYLLDENKRRGLKLFLEKITNFQGAVFR
jgi:chorismate dehydratase